MTLADDSDEEIVMGPMSSASNLIVVPFTKSVISLVGRLMATPSIITLASRPCCIEPAPTPANAVLILPLTLEVIVKLLAAPRSPLINNEWGVTEPEPLSTNSALSPETLSNFPATAPTVSPAATITVPITTLAVFLTVSV